MNAEKPHHRQTRSHGVCFWNGNTAGNEDNATRAVVYLGPPGMPYPEFEFKWPEQKYEVEKLERALLKAYERGIYAAKQEIREVLGVRESR
jgi:hypothetical protein